YRARATLSKRTSPLGMTARRSFSSEVLVLSVIRREDVASMRQSIASFRWGMAVLSAFRDPAAAARPRQKLVRPGPSDRSRAEQVDDRQGERLVVHVAVGVDEVAQAVALQQAGQQRGRLER